MNGKSGKKVIQERTRRKRQDFLSKIVYRKRYEIIEKEKAAT